jgi:hypothetical protein
MVNLRTDAVLLMFAQVASDGLFARAANLNRIT